MNNVLPNHRDKPYGGAWPVEDKEVLKFLTNNNALSNHKDFVADYYKWMSKPHSINGIEHFNSLAYCNGSTEAFDKFYHKHMHRNLRFLRGEYFYHQIMGRRYFKESNFIDDDVLITENDVVVMSVPFSDTGSVPKNYTKIMEACESLKVPVLLDMAYINLAIDLQINVDYQCIDTITTSLSKVFPVAYSRIGMRMQRENLDDTLDAYEMNSYLNTHSVNIGHALIKKYKADYSFNKYRQQQLSFCNMLDLTPSDSFIFGIDYDNKSQEYNRGGPSNRFCFSKHFQ
tara:strand:- start:1 stop:858 length:858 start_codon:yes stop_codon:yes gene_type:complete